MKYFLPILLLCFPVHADDADLAEKISRHQEGARTLSDEQDELAADVQQLIIEQTDAKVIELFEAVEYAMDDASEMLFELDTGGPTIAAETEVIEKIYEAAKEKQKQSQEGESGEGSKPGSAMMDMLGRMLGMEPGSQPGQQPGDQAGQGQTGDSSAANARVEGTHGGKVEERTVPKGAGSAGRGLPREYQDALKAYNQGAESLSR